MALQAPAKFEWPEFYSFPPFFTLQPVEETRKKQLDMWVDLVVRWCKVVGLSEIHVSSADKLELFSNKAIGRALSRGMSLCSHFSVC
jgi:ESCRT-II complex subunit VPS25